MLDELMLGSYAGHKEIGDLKIRVNNLNKEVQHLQCELRGDVDNDDYVNHKETVSRQQCSGTEQHHWCPHSGRKQRFVL